MVDLDAYFDRLSRYDRRIYLYKRHAILASGLTPIREIEEIGDRIAQEVVKRLPA